MIISDAILVPSVLTGLLVPSYPIRYYYFIVGVGMSLPSPENQFKSDGLISPKLLRI